MSCNVFPFLQPHAEGFWHSLSLGLEVRDVSASGDPEDRVYFSCAAHAAALWDSTLMFKIEMIPSDCKRCMYAGHRLGQ